MKTLSRLKDFDSKEGRPHVWPILYSEEPTDPFDIRAPEVHAFMYESIYNAAPVLSQAYVRPKEDGGEMVVQYPKGLRTFHLMHEDYAYLKQLLK